MYVSLLHGHLLHTVNMATGILSLQPSPTAIRPKPKSIQRKTGKDATELNPEARHENTCMNGRMLNPPALELDFYSLAHHLCKM